MAAIRVVEPLLAGIDASLLQPPVNVFRLSLHPLGLAPRIANLAEWRGHLLKRLRQQLDAAGDAVLATFSGSCARTPNRPSRLRSITHGPRLRRYRRAFELRTLAGVLALFSTTTVFGTPVDITLSEAR